MSVSEAAKGGDYADTLRALRDRLANEIDSAVEPRDVAVLSARLSDVLGQLNAVKPPETSMRDDLARKRAKRRADVRPADSAGSDNAASGDK